MNAISNINWNEEVQLDAEETYQTLARSLARSEGFGIFLVRCVEGERDRLIQRLQRDLTAQQMAQLKLEAALEDGNLYNRVAAMLQVKPNLNVLFINGLEKSFEAYIKPGYGGQGDYYKMDSVPRVLGHLNLQRERFRNDFPVSLVFFLSPFGLKYMARRAPDFFDWRSGIYEFVPDPETVAELSRSMVGEYRDYLQLSNQERSDRILAIRAALGEEQSNDTKASLAFQQGNLFSADQAYEEAISAYDMAIRFNPNKEEAWYNRGLCLDDLGRYKEAINSYDRTIEFQPDLFEAWYHRGLCLTKLGRYEEAIESYSQTIILNPTYPKAWYNRACAQSLSRNFQAASQDLAEAIRLAPDPYKKMAQTDKDFDDLWDNSEIKLLLH